MHRFLYLAIFILSAFPVQSQASYIFNRFSSSDGLNTNKVNCVWQDKKGFLWIGTENGIQRFDGSKFINFRNDHEKSVPPYGIDQITGSNDGQIWIRQKNQIGKFDPVSFHYTAIPLNFDEQLPVEAEASLYPDSKGNMFLCSHKSNLMYYDSVQNRFSEDIPIKVPPGWTVNKLFEDTLTGDYWICSDRGLAVYQSNTGSLFYKGNNPQKLPILEDESMSPIFDFYIDKKRTYWLIRWGYRSEIQSVIIHYDPATNQICNDKDQLQSLSNEFNGPFWINETKDGQIWYGGINTLVCFDKKRNILVENIKLTTREYDINCREVKQIYEDRESNLWFTTDNGLYVLNPQQEGVFNLFFDKQTKGGEVILNAIQETDAMENWIGSWGDGILIFDDQFRRTNFNPHQTVSANNIEDAGKVWELYQDPVSGLIWTGCQNGTLYVYSPTTKSVLYELHPSVFENVPVRQIIGDKNGNLFFGTQKGRLVKKKKDSPIDDRSFELVRDFYSSIYVLYKDKEDQLWVGTRNLGLFLMDQKGEKVIQYFNKKDNSSPYWDNTIYDVVQYNDSIYFVSTGFLNILNIKSGNIRNFTQRDGLPGTNLTQLVLDDDKILWFTTNNGLASYNYEKDIFIPYTERSGTIMGRNLSYSKYKMKNGEIWFSGANSLFGFNPIKLKSMAIPPDVTITDFKIFNTYIPLDSLMAEPEIRLKPEQNSIAFYFSSLSFSQQEKLIYYYKLDGVDRDWIKAEKNLAANYTTLAPGDYTFNVRCINIQGQESARVTSLSLKILPHFYQTWWFFAIIILFTGWLTYFIYRQQLTKLLAVERIRNKVARDLHDDVGSTLSTINILSSMAKTKLLTDPVKTSEYISKITENSQHMMEAMDDIVWSIKPDNDSLQKIVARMREYASGILEPKDIEIYFSVTDDIQDLKLKMETRRDVFLIFKEAINNIAKYAQCTQVEILLSYANKQLLMHISDNGLGFNVDSADSGNGLGNMRKRAEALRGSLQMESSPGNGTHISLGIPVDR